MSIESQPQRRHLYQLLPQLQGSGKITEEGREVVRAIGCPQSAGKCYVFRALHHSASELIAQAKSTRSVRTAIGSTNQTLSCQTEKEGTWKGKGCVRNTGRREAADMLKMHGVYARNSKVPLKISLGPTLCSCIGVCDPPELMNLVISSSKPIANSLYLL